mgnify:CR=1 FL=1
MNTPKIRFKGFTDDWEQRKLGALMEDGIILEQSDGNHGELYPRSEEFVNEGIPYIAASSISSDGERIDFNLTKYLSMERAIQFRKGVAKNGDVLLAHNATVGPSVMLSMDYEFAILSTSLTLYRLDKEKMSPMFFLQAIRSGYFQKQLEVFMKQTTRSQVPILTQRNLQISYPINKVEQERIGEFLSNLDHLITLHQRKCDETKQLKKFMLQKMFPKNGEKNPKIRFEGFTDDWEQRKLGDVLKERTERAKGEEELLSVTIANGVIRQADSEKRNIASEDKRNYKVVKKGDIPYNSMRMWQGAVGNSQYDGIVSPAYTILVPTDEANDKFFMELFKKENSLQRFKRWSQGLTSDTWNLKYPALSTMQFFIPSIKEQKRIANCLQELDYLITLHQRKCEKLKALKKFMLQNMFI